MFKYFYKMPMQFSNIVMYSDGEHLTGLNFCDDSLGDKNIQEKFLPIFKITSEWLDLYFSGKEPNFLPKYKVQDATPFQMAVVDATKNIPYASTTTYGDIAKIVAKKFAKKEMSARAVGRAVGWNPICIIIPCHRVVGKNGNLTGYGGGLQNKIELLKLEHIDLSKFFVPKEYSKKGIKF